MKGWNYFQYNYVFHIYSDETMDVGGELTLISYLH